MKKIILRWFWLTLLLVLALSSALANSWGLSGELLQAVMEDKRWDDYSSITNQQGDFAVMGSRYHNVLMQYKDSELLTYPLAVWQETDQLKVGKPRLKLRNDGQALEISYGDRESYTFQLNHRFDTYWSADALIHAYVKGLNFQRDGYGFIVDDGNRQVRWQRNVLLDDFNIRLFPQSIEEVLHLNRMYELLNSADRLGTDLGKFQKSGTGKGTAPVYSAPFGNSAWRASKGKAALGLSGEYWTLGTYYNQNGEAYAKIRYEVSERTQRVGYVLVSELNLEPSEDEMPKTINVPLEARTDTYLTDDPVVSQYRQFYVPPGMQFICMGTYGTDYAYVAAKAKNGSFVDGGKIVKDGDQIVWGYVPLRDLMISTGDGFRNTIEWDAMARFAGQWTFAAGGVGITDVLMLYADGTWEGYTDTHTGGTWRLTRYNPQDNLYWSEVPYEITFYWEDGTVCTKGFWPNDTGFSLLYWEGSGGYERLEGPFTPPSDTDGNG